MGLKLRGDGKLYGLENAKKDDEEMCPYGGGAGLGLKAMDGDWGVGELKTR